MKNKAIAGGVVALLVVVWIFYGRFAVEGGKAPWAIINDRLDVLKAALASGVSASEKQEALWQAVFKDNTEAVRLLLAAGANPNTVKLGENCVLEYPTTRFETIKALIEGGADPTNCRSGKKGFASNVVHQFSRAVPEPELIAFLQLLDKKGMQADAAALAKAEENKLEKLVAYLKNPSGAADFGRAKKLALRGGADSIEAAGLKQVCRGEGVAALPAYTKEPDAISPAYVFEVRDDEVRGARDILQPWWSADKLEHTQVVACARLVSKRLAKECKYEGGVTVGYYDGTYELSVREGKTANQLASKMVSLEVHPPVDCPIFQMGGNESVYPQYKSDLVALIQPVIGAQ